MASEHEKYLAANVISEGSIVTYRSLSHHFKIHASKAKEILQAFHQAENARKPGSVHATYFVSGLREQRPDAPPGRDADGDVAMPSSPGLSSSAAQPAEAQPVVAKVLALAREADLDEVKARYATVTAVHVYSVGPSPLKDLEVLSTVTQQINERHASEDPLIYYKDYGVILNPDVRRRTAAKKVATEVPVDTSSMFASKKASAAPAKTTPSSTNTAAVRPEPKAEAKKDGKPASMKKEASDIFKSFAKAKPKPPPKHDPTADMPMTGDSESEEEEIKSQSKQSSTKRKEERESRKQQMQALLDEEDEPMEDANEPAADHESDEEAEPEPEPEPEQIEEPALRKDEPEPEEAPPVTVSDGRRRGKRRVMKKKTAKDEDGYLITKEELVWESFSEEEPAPSSSKPRSGGSKPKATGGKGQGSIMSFFGKK